MSRAGLLAIPILMLSTLAWNALAQDIPGQIPDPSTYQGSMELQRREQESDAQAQQQNAQMQQRLDQNYASYAPQGGGGASGGGGNFGIVTEFDFGLHPMQRQVVGGNILFPRSLAKAVLGFYADYEAEAPAELALDALLMSNPGMPGGGVVGFTLCYSGPANQADAIMTRIRSLGTPVVDTVKAIDYIAIQRSGDETEQRAIGAYTKTGYVERISPNFIAAMVDGLEDHPERTTIAGFQQLGGVISQVRADATAFPFRKVHATALLLAEWPATSDAAPHLKSLRQYWSTLSPYTYGFYTNDAVEESQKQVDENYMGNYVRLVKLKNQYDPSNLFRLNANVRPSV